MSPDLLRARQEVAAAAAARTPGAMEAHIPSASNSSSQRRKQGLPQHRDSHFPDRYRGWDGRWGGHRALGVFKKCSDVALGTRFGGEHCSVGVMDGLGGFGGVFQPLGLCNSMGEGSSAELIYLGKVRPLLWGCAGAGDAPVWKGGNLCWSAPTARLEWSQSCWRCHSHLFLGTQQVSGA